MRNLLGRLNVRSPDDLHRIAAFWRVPVGDGPKHRTVGALYRTMTDPRAGRDVWDRLSQAERAMISHLALTSETALTVTELAQRLSLSDEEARDVAAALYRAGMIVREGDDDDLAIGEKPRLFLPLEVWQFVRRVRDEQEFGDLRGRSLRTLLELLDDTELEDAARHWGLRIIPGLRQRNDLISQILGLVADPTRVAGIITGATRRREAAQLWDAVCQAHPPETGTDAPSIILTEALVVAGFDPEGDDPAVALRARSTLGELESRLLVWHTYDAGGNRFVFVPAEIREPASSADQRPTLPHALPDDDVDAPAWRHPAAFAWDLLTLLRALSASDAPRVTDVEQASRAWLRRLNGRLWHAGDEIPPVGYLHFLVTLAQDEGLVAVEERESGDVLMLAPGVRAWRDRSFPEQTVQLRLRWLSAQSWPEGARRGELAVEGADWRGFRRKLLGHLGQLAENDGERRWYPLDGLTTWIAGQDVELLGETFSAASAGYTGATGSERRRNAIALAIGTTMVTALNWFGIVQVGNGPEGVRVIRVQADALAPTTTQPGQKDDIAKRDAPITVNHDGQVSVRAASPVRVWSLLAFAEQESLGEASVYRLTEAALGRALAAGFDLQQITSFLERQSGRSLPESVTSDLMGWAQGFRRVRVRRVILLRPDDPKTLDDLQRAARAAGWACRRIGDDELLVEPPDAATTLTAREREGLGPLLDALRTSGFHPA